MGLGGEELTMGCCGSGNTAGATSQYVVTVAGKLVTEGGVDNDGKFDSSAAARIWIAQNVTGAAATVRAVPKS